MTKKSHLVYSTERGRVKDTAQQQKAPSSDGVIRIRVETKGRKGKGVSVIWGFNHSVEELKALASKLKQQCGSGGAVKDWTIEIQGDHRQKLKTELESLGYSVKLSGG